MKRVFHGALGLVLVAVSGSAPAQTGTSENASDMVEARWPPVGGYTLRVDPGNVITRPVDGTPTTFVPPSATAPPATARSDPTVVAPRPRSHADRQTATRAKTVATRHMAKRPVTRTSSVRSAGRSAPLTLDQAQRRIVYRAISAQEVLPAATPVVSAQTPPATPVPSLFPPILQPFVPPILNLPTVAQQDDIRTDIVIPPTALTGYAVTAPAVAAPFATAPVVAATDGADVVGSRLPPNVPLVALPRTIALRIPALARYSYAVIGNRVVLVDPASGAVAADVTP
jgi:hypothetical protein